MGGAATHASCLMPACLPACLRDEQEGGGGRGRRLKGPSSSGDGAGQHGKDQRLSRVDRSIRPPPSTSLDLGPAWMPHDGGEGALAYVDLEPIGSLEIDDEARIAISPFARSSRLRRYD